MPERLIDRIVATLAREFSDVADVEAVTTVCSRLLTAALLAGLIGWERERGAKSAGLRTHMLVGVGSALMVLAPQQAGVAPAELTRVIQGVVAGIGFLGAGAILKSDDERRIRGLTTAGSIWATAAIGIAVGMGRELTAVISTLMVFAILSLLTKVEAWIKPRRKPDDDNG